MENNFLKIGKYEFNIPYTKDWTKEEFFKKYKGKVDFDLENAWHRIQEAQKQLGLTENPKYSKDAPKAKRTKKED